MPKIFTSKTQKTGKIGESIATRFLMKHNFSILDRNYTKKWGEIDIIAERKNKLYFIEVKSIVIHETFKSADIDDISTFRPEENMHSKKIKRMMRVIQTYLMSYKNKKDWQVDLLLVFLDIKNRKAKVKVLSDIILN